MSEKQECANQGLLPCPFCGGGCLEIVEIEIPFMENKEWFSVRCLNCKFECDTQKDDIIAKRKWNARPTEEALQAKLDEMCKAKEEVLAREYSLHKKLELTSNKLAVAVEALEEIGKAGTWHEVCKAWDKYGKQALKEIGE